MSETVLASDAARQRWLNRESKQTGDSFAGLQYDTEVGSAAGCVVTLYLPPGVTEQQAQAAMAEARHKRDVIDFYRLHIPQEWVDEEEGFTPLQSRPNSWIDAIRWIVEHGSCRRVDDVSGELVPENKTGGVLVDLFSASVMKQIYDHLNPANQAKFEAMPITKASVIAFRLAENAS